MKPRILIVEDEKAIQIALRGLLRRDGYEVELADDGEMALRKLADETYDLILTDLSLGRGPSGMDVLRTSKERCAETAVVMMTAYGSEKIAVEAMQQGAEDYVPKPFDNEELRVVVSRALERTQLQCEHLQPHAAPDGTVTLMFSDIESYTRLLERLGDLAAYQLVQEHNTIVREQTKAHGGHEVELRGDGFLLAFASARQAVQCAIALQRAFLARNESDTEPISIRIGLHTGEAIKDADKFFGKTVVQAFRIADLARGGEILVSLLTKELVESAGDLAFDDGREVELKGLEGTHRVFGVRLSLPPAGG